MAGFSSKISTDLRGKYSFTSAKDEFPVEIHNVDLDEILVQWHWHEAFEAVYLSKGNMEINVESEKYIISEGNGYLLKSEVLHSITPLGDGDHSMLLVLFHPKLIGGSESSILWRKYLNPLAEDSSLKIVPLKTDIPWETEALSLIRDTWESMSEADDGYEFLVRNNMSKLIYLCFQYSSTTSSITDKEQRDADRLRVMLNFIQEHFNEDVTTAMIARSAMLSESECQRCFKRMMQTSPIKYLRRLRIQRSAELLADKSLKISDIALKCGFQDMSYFSNVFKKLCGKTPGEYRESL